MGRVIFEFRSAEFVSELGNAKKKAEVEKPTEEREARFRANYFLRFPASVKDETKSAGIESASFTFKSRQVVSPIPQSTNQLIQ